jgi:alpha-beta hydrolase superfamily lysophospholipase
MLPALLVSFALAGQDVTLTTEDKVSLHAISQPVKGAKKGLILVHAAGREAADWTFFAEKMARSEMLVVAPDLRGHGANVKPGAAPLTEADYSRMVTDVRAAATWLRSKGATEIACVGASLGANLCLQAAAVDPQIGNVALLSATLKAEGVTTLDALPKYGDRPLLIVASREDSYAARSATMIQEKTTGPKHMEILEGAGTGTKMLNRDPALEGILQSWLLGSFRLSNGQEVTTRPAISTDVEQVQTTGTRLDEKR